MARKTADLAAAKARKQKKIAIGGIVLLLGLLAFSVPKTLKMMKGPAPPPPPAAAPQPAPGQPAPGQPAGTPAGTPAGGAAAPVPTAAPAVLIDTGGQPEAGLGQLVSFERFASKDPFAQQAEATAQPVPAAPPADAGTGAQTAPEPIVPEPATPATPPVVAPPTTTPPPPPAPAPKPTSAVLAINGVRETVEQGGTFPEADPVFELRALTSTGVKIGIAGGSLTGGAQTVTLTKGKKVTLMNTADGTRYELVLVSLA